MPFDRGMIDTMTIQPRIPTVHLFRDTNGGRVRIHLSL